jgi:histone H3/H4
MASQNSSVAAAPAVASGPVSSSGTPSVANSQTTTAANPPPVVPVNTGHVGGKNISRGKGGKFVGGKLGALRHVGLGTPGIVGYSRPRQRKIARRGGIKMMAKETYEPNDDMIYQFALEFTKNALCYATHSRRKTLTVQDCMAALKRMGRPMYSQNAIY